MVELKKNQNYLPSPFRNLSRSSNIAALAESTSIQKEHNRISRLTPSHPPTPIPESHSSGVLTAGRHVFSRPAITTCNLDGITQLLCEGGCELTLHVPITYHSESLAHVNNKNTYESRAYCDCDASPPILLKYGGA